MTELIKKIVKASLHEGNYLLVVVGVEPGEPRFVKGDGTLATACHEETVIRSHSKDAGTIINAWKLGNFYESQVQV